MPKMYDSWYQKFDTTFDDSFAQYHKALLVKVDRSLQSTHTTSLSDVQILDWLRQGDGDEDGDGRYLVRAMCVQAFMIL